MESQPVIMLQIAQRDWTTTALQAACQMARTISADVLLVKLVTVQHISWLGTEWGYMDFTRQEQDEMAGYYDMIEENKVHCKLFIYQYAFLADAIAEVAERYHAQIAFATVPPSFIPGWQKFQLHRLRQHLAHQHCELIARPLSNSIYSTHPMPIAGQEQQVAQEEMAYIELPAGLHPTLHTIERVNNSSR
jgi:hypothetical protein